MRLWPLLIVVVFIAVARGHDPAPREVTRFDPAAAERGRLALTGKCFSPAFWSLEAYGDAWRRWAGVASKPANYDAAFRDYYGLAAAPYPNHNLPMGLREGPRLLTKGLSTDCLLCHGGSMFGQSIVGLGNASLDIQAFFEDLTAADGMPPHTPFAFGRVRGTSEAGAMAVFLLGRRNPDLSLRASVVKLGLHDDLIGDAPAWWLLKKKSTMYATGGADARSVRSIMQFMMSPLNGASQFEKAEADFADIRQFFLSIEPPKYPGPIDRARAHAGEALFRANCARCHGSYGPEGRYPNKIIPIDEIGTDRRRFDGIEPRFGEYYNKSWFAAERSGWVSEGYKVWATAGYQAPPLDGIWATAPYFHNGSVPTVYDVLSSATRPSRFTRSYRTDPESYDHRKLGWKVTEVDAPASNVPPFERRKIYDTRELGRSHQGHTFGDHLTDAERLAIIEYLKTL